jgi:aconitate hydratase
MTDPFNARRSLDTPLGKRQICSLDALDNMPGAPALESLPYCIKILLEAALRHCDGYVITEESVRALRCYDGKNVGEQEIPFRPGRVVLQDFTGVPAVVDLAAMRSAMVRMTGDPAKASGVNPLVPCDLVIDHSVQVDAFGSDQALTINSGKEFERNMERYQFLKWGQQSFDNFRVVPPGIGIVHQVNLEYLAKVVWDSGEGDDAELYPDSLVGTDSHTTMINGLGVVGWGVGGIEAEAVMLGQPIYMLIPEVVGFKMTGKLPQGATATDLVLTVTQILREHGVVGKFVEFYGPALDDMALATRATIANMAPEYGATMGFFPVDGLTLDYLRLSGRDEKHIQAVEQYCKAQGLWRTEGADVSYTDQLELDISTVEPSLAGPKRPQDRISLAAMKDQWEQDLSITFGRTTVAAGSTGVTMQAEGGTITSASLVKTDPGFEGVETEYQGKSFKLRHGAVVIAAITSCTNTSNPQVMVAAGLVARKARALGLGSKPWVKTSLAPGSKVVTEYFDKSALTEDLNALGFNLVGYGCTTCIGNSGPLPDPIRDAIRENDLVVTSVLSGNRNFEGRISPDTQANYLASPPLVVAYAIAGNVDVDISKDVIAQTPDGKDVYLKDIWPTESEIDAIVSSCIGPDQFKSQYEGAMSGPESWQNVEVAGGDLYGWDATSTYIQEPPFFVGMSPDAKPIQPIKNARVLAKLGDSVTTDHISPAGAFKKESSAGQYLTDNDVPVSMFNSYGSRRGNHEVMMRGTFANIRVRNQLVPGTEGGYTKNFLAPVPDVEPGDLAGEDNPMGSQQDPGTGTSGAITSIYQAAMDYVDAGVPLVVLAGKDYGMGSSRDWAAKGTFLLGVRAVIATSYERIHRSNLVGMGVLPLQFADGQTHETVGLTGTETFDFQIDDQLQARQEVLVTATRTDGTKIEFTTTCRIDTPVEIDYFRNGGILHTVLRKMAKA